MDHSVFIVRNEKGKKNMLYVSDKKKTNRIKRIERMKGKKERGSD